MRSLHQRLGLALVLGLGLSALRAQAEEAELLALAGASGAASPPENAGRRRHDYSRFSNGPRRVPKPRGASFARAQALGIGGLEATRELLRGRIGQELLQAVRGQPPRRLLWPVVGGRFGRGFGFVRKRRTDLRHNGVDIAAADGDVVRAAADGLVVYSDNTLRGFGNAVVILHKNGWTTLYAHNRRNTVPAGWHVQRGERIALVGMTGIARGPHLHFELRDRGRLRDPARLFEGKESRELSGPLVPLATGRPGSGGDLEREASREEERAAPSAAAELPFAVGSRAAARAALRGELQAADIDLGRSFRDLLWPVQGGGVTRAFTASAHRGIDIAAAENSGVRAAADGLVVFSDRLAGYGHTIVLLHAGDWVTVYAANRDSAVRPGQRVLRGQWIARIDGDVSEQPHLHFEWRVAGAPRDPWPAFAGAPR